MRRRTIGPGVSFFAFQDIITAVVGIFILITLTLILELNQRVESAARPANADAAQMQQQIVALIQESERLQSLYNTRLKQHTNANSITTFNYEKKLREVTANTVATKQQISNAKQALKSTLSERLKAREVHDRLVAEGKMLDDERQKTSNLETKLQALANKANKIKQDTSIVYRDRIDDLTFVCLLQLNQQGIEIKDAATKTVQQLNSVKFFEEWSENNSSTRRHYLILLEPTGTQYFPDVREILQDANATFGFDLVEAGHESALSFEWDIEK